jgi:hypothetical protein
MLCKMRMLIRVFFERFLYETADAVFLFAPEVPAYLQALKEAILRLRHLHRQSEAEINEEKKGKLIDLQSEQEARLSNELPLMIEIFKPYLKLGNI